MAKLNKKTATFVIIVIIVLIIVGVKAYFALNAKAIDSVEARSKGNPAAKVQIVEFIDLECPACAYGSKVVKELIEKHPNDIRVQVKYFPLIRTHRHAMQVALYNECAGAQGKFWEFHYPLMLAQQQWSPLLSADAFFQDLAIKAGANMQQLNTCLSSDEAAAIVNNDKILGQSLGVQSTPTYFINNKMIVGAKALEEELGTYFPKTGE